MSQKVERVRTSLQIEEDLNLHLKGWLFQRVGWALMLVFIASAALGLFGNGVLSRKTIVKEGSTLDFERFTRGDSDTQMAITTDHGNGTVKIALSPQFTESFKVENILPEPREQSVEKGFTVYQFEVQSDGKLTFFLTSRRAGSVHSTVLVDDTEFQLRQLIYP